MKVNKSKAINALIPILDNIFDDADESVRRIRTTLEGLNSGDELNRSEVNKIFGKWANWEANPRDPRNVVKFICAYIRDEMFIP